MTTPSTPRRGAHLLRSFLGSRGGATAIIYALLALPIAMIALGVIDLSRLMVLRNDLQASLDASALIAARSDAVTDDQVDQAGQGAFGEEFTTASSGTQASFRNGGDDDVVATASASIRPIILGLLGRDTLTAHVRTVIRRGPGSPLELALVLDTTGSMEGDKLAALKTSATSMVDKLTTDAGGNVKIGVVPFGQYVNVGIERRDEPWADVDPDSTTVHPPGDCYQTSPTKRVCQPQQEPCTRFNDGVPYQATCTKWINCVDEPAEVKTVCPPESVSHHRFYGCMGSPSYPQNVRDDDPTRRYPGIMNESCGTEMTLLTADADTVKGAVAALAAKGSTYIPAGLDWGFNMLSQVQPLTEAAAYDASGQNLQPHKALVLMTDGENTIQMNAANGRHDQTPSGVATQANAYTAELCKNIKAKKIEVFTIAFQITDSTAKNMLKKCASDNEHYFDATDSAKLDAAFDNIAKTLKTLYIAR